jgi:hypothetical protein
MRTIKEYILENYDEEEMKDICKHGCVSGCASGLIYYHETVKFHDEYEKEIWDMLFDDAQDQDMTILELIASFNGKKDVYDIEQFKNLLCWYAIEKVCFGIVNEREEAA